MFDKRMTSQFELYILFGFLFTICGECKEEGLKFYCDLGSPVIPLTPIYDVITNLLENVTK